MSRRHVVVTGAASGIGAALYTKLLAQDCRVTGLDIVATDTGIIACNLADGDSINRAIGQIEGEIHGLALVAGLPGTKASGDVLRVNFLSARHLVGALSPRMVRNSAIVAVASIAAHRCTWDVGQLDAVLAADDEAALALARQAGCEGNGMYELSKRLLLHWVPHMAARLSKVSIRVNAVSPGPVETPILADFYATIGADRMEVSRQLVGRHAHAGEIANVIDFLLADQSGWVNGVEIKADGGMQAIRSVTR